MLALGLFCVAVDDSGDFFVEDAVVNVGLLGVKVFVDPKSLVYLDGMEMDYVKNGLNEGFEFNNPNKKGECGCGESFTV